MHCGRPRRRFTWARTDGIFSCAWAANARNPRSQEESWDYLKHRLRELGLVDAEQGVLRTKADCLRICVGGPIAVVYPEGTWYRRLLPAEPGADHPGTPAGRSPGAGAGLRDRTAPRADHAAGFHQLHGTRGAAHAQRAAACDLQQFRTRGQVADEAVDLRLAGRQFDDEPIERRIEHPAAGAHHIAAQAIGVLRAHLEFQQHELALEMLAGGHVLDPHHIDELVQLIDDLLDDGIGAGGHHGDARHRGVVRRGDRQGLDVVAAGGKQARDARQRSGLVLQKDGDDVTHGIGRRITRISPKMGHKGQL